MTPLPRGPWLRDAEQIAPFLKVCDITYLHGNKIAAFVVLLLVLTPICLVVLANATCAVLQPDAGFTLLCSFALAGCLLCFLAILVGLELGRERLLLGERGIAVWLPWRTRVVLFDDLGTVWRYVPQPARADQPLVVVLEHSDGQRVEITPRFEDYLRVALRVLEELARRAPERDKKPRPEGSDAIKSANRDITEPREERE